MLKNSLPLWRRNRLDSGRFAPGLLVLLIAGLLTVGAAAEVLAGGTWTTKGYAVKGTWTIVSEEGKPKLLLDEAFETKNAPDLKLFLSPLAVDELTSRNAMEGALLIAPLDNPKGAQSYSLPQETNLQAYKAVILHCERYTKLWAAAPLR